MLKMLSVGQAALFLGVCVKTMHRWEESGELSPDWRTPGGHRRYELASLTCWVEDSSKEQRGTVLYARVSSHDQKEDLSRQQELLRSVAKAKSFDDVYELKDIGSGINFGKKGFLALLKLLFSGKIQRIVVTHRDRLMRFGFSLIEQICTFMNVQIEVLDHSEHSFEVQLSQDLIEIITVFSAKLYGKRSAQHRRMRQSLFAV